jgi:hypothetical protein
LIKKGLIYVCVVTVALYGLRYLHWKGLLMQKQGYYATYRIAFLEKNNFEVLFLGSSRAANHYNVPLFDSLTGKNSFNLSVSGANTQVSFAILKAYLVNSSAPKQIFFETDLHNIDMNTHDIMEFNNFFPFFQNKTLLREFNNIDPRMKHFYYNAYYSWPYTGYRNISTSLRCWFGHVTQMDKHMNKGYFYDDIHSNLNYSPTKPYKVSIETINGNYLDSIILLCKSKKINLTLVTSPMFAGGKIDLLNKDQIVEEINQIVKKNCISYWEMSSRPYCNRRDLFVNHFHLNYLGARLFTLEFAEKYSNICQKNALKP